MGLFLSVLATHAATVRLESGGNGPAALPSDPVQWFADPVSATNAHFLEGHSIPFRLVCEGVSTGYHAVEIEWDSKRDGAHALDFLTSLNRLTPHGAFAGHGAAEMVDALAGLGAGFSSPATFAIPTPSGDGSTVTGEPVATFSALPSGERVFTIWNGVITNLSYLSEASLTNATATSRLLIEFEATETNVVIAWGGHIATAQLWGTNPVATGAIGQPYAMRAISLDSLPPTGTILGGASGDAVSAAFAVAITGTTTTCPGTTNAFVAQSQPTPAVGTYTWSLGGNSAGAIIISDSTNSSVEVFAPAAGTFELNLLLTDGIVSATDSFTATSRVATTASALTNQSLCAGATANFTTEATGDAPLAYAWFKDGTPLTNELAAALTLTNLSGADAGDYCVVVTGECGVVTNCATLEVILPATITCPTNLAVQCYGEIPAPDTNQLVVIGAVEVAHLGDVAVTNGCEIEVTRTYAAINSCTVTSVCTQTITVQDTIPPGLVCASNRVEECSGAWDFDSPVVSDNCDASLVLVTAETVTNATCGATFSATRTWLAVDACGNSNSCSQTVTVVDTTPPIITCASNRVVECSTAWTFDEPAVSDACDTNVLVTITDATNATCGATFIATRTWLAVDACGNSNSCSQIVTVVDTTPPAIVCSSNIVVECTGGGGTTVAFAITASDACDTNVVITSSPVSGAFYPLGTNLVTSVAVDDCGNSNVCTFTVTVIDTTPPTIACPANIIAAEFPYDSGGAVVNFAAPVVSDICESSLNVSVTPPSGSVFPVGTNVVTCVVADSSGNSNVCTFTVRVIPYRLFVTTNVTTTADSGPGSFRQALHDANDAPGENLILFNISTPPPHVIQLESPLPEITSPVIINGWSQPGFTGFPLITITGAGLTNAVDGLVFHAGNSTVRGLVLHGFATAVKLFGPGNNTLQGNFIGADASGNYIAGNTGDGILIASPRNLIGGTSNAAPNVIGGNAGNGIRFTGAAATNNLIRGNYLGVGANLVSELGNGLDGVRLENGAARNQIGGNQPAMANGIAFNGGSGVNLLPTSGPGNGIYPNSIFANAALGIDLNADGITANDNSDGDAGPNQLQNYPVLADARSASGSLTIDGSLDGVGNALYRLDFYLSNLADPSGSGEGRTHLGARVIEVNGSGLENFSFAFPVSAVYTQVVTATATDAGDNTSEFSPAVTVRTPPVLEAQPVSTNTTPGGMVVLCASASGTSPIYYQWRLNGVNIPGATNQCFEITAADYTSGGSYSVVIYNVLGASLTATAGVQVEVTNAVLAADHFADATALTGLSGETAWSNRNATREVGEPLHAAKYGQHSVWYKWTAPEKGILTLGLRGSDFDTLLAVYRGTNVATLYGEGGDEDRGGYYTSGLRINVIKGRTYHFAVDGYGDESGRFFFNWQHEFTPHLLPAILAQPQSVTVPPGTNVTFTVIAARVCGNGHTNCSQVLHYPPEEELPNLAFQWLYNEEPIPDATNNSHTVFNVQPEQLGRYRARISTPWQTIESADADLEINLTGDTTQPVQSTDKLLDVFTLPPWVIGDLLPPTTSPGGGFSRDTLVRGYTGTQIFNTSGSGTGAADEPICGVLGGASEYITFVPAETGILFLNTDGSSYDTVMAVFLRSPTNASQLTYLTCDNNSGKDGKDSALSVPVVAGQTNVVLVDGVNGASGTLYLSYSLLSSINLRAVGVTAGGNNIMQVLSRTNANFTIQRSTNMVQWSSIVTTNSPSGSYQYTDPQPPGSVRYFYRAQLLP